MVCTMGTTAQAEERMLTLADFSPTRNFHDRKYDYAEVGSITYDNDRIVIIGDIHADDNPRVSMESEKVSYHSIVAGEDATLALSNNSIVTAQVKMSKWGYLYLDGSAIQGNVDISSEASCSCFGNMADGESSLIKGNFTLADGSQMEFMINEQGTTTSLLYVDGSLNIQGKVTLLLEPLSQNDGEAPNPKEGTRLFISKAMSGQVDNFSCMVGWYPEDEAYWDGDGWCVDEVTKALDMHVEMHRQANGLLVFTLENGSSGGGAGSVTPTTPPVNSTPITTETVLSAEQFADKKWCADIRTGGNLDTTALPADARLTDDKITGSGGTLTMGGEQTLAISHSGTLGYGIVGKDGLAGHLIFSGTGSETWVLVGREYLVDDLTCSQGTLTISAQTTVGRAAAPMALDQSGDGQTDILVYNKGTVNNDGKVYAATLETATEGVFNNNGSAEVGSVSIGENSALFNAGKLTVGEMQISGALNNSGRLESAAELDVQGVVYNSGTIVPNISLQKGAKLDMVDKGQSNLVRVGTGAVLCGSAGNVAQALVAKGGRLGSTTELTGLRVENATMADGAALGFALSASSSHLSIGELVLDGAVQMVFGVDESIISNPGVNIAKATFTIPVLQVENVNNEEALLDAEVIIEDEAGYLEDGVTLQWNGGNKVLQATGKLNEAAFARFVAGDAALLADTLWSSAGSLRTFAGICASSNRLGEQGTFWASGFGNFSNTSSKKGLSGYEFRNSGFAVGATANLAERSSVGIAIGQAYGKHTSDNNLLRDDIDSTMFSLYGTHTQGLGGGDSLTIQGVLAYGSAENKADTHRYGNAALPGKAKWDDDLFTIEVQAAWNHAVAENRYLSPFIGLTYLHAAQDDIHENSVGGTRLFEGATLQTWTLSLGATWRSIHKLGGEAYLTPHASLAYEGDLARRNPRTATSLVKDKVYGRGHNLGRNAVRANIGLDWKIDDTWTTGAAYELSARSGELNQSVNVQVIAEF